MYNGGFMKKKLSTVGNSLGLVIERPILELLKIDRDTELEMTTDGNRLIIEPIRSGKKGLRASAEKIMKKHDSTFKKLAK
jgi:antitoxin component of MazEF toxin-antitoxin module